DHKQRVDNRRHALDRLLAVRRRITNVLAMWSNNVWEPPREGRDHRTGVVDRQRRLGNIGKFALAGRLEALDVLSGLNQRDGTLRQLPQRANDFRMAGMADEDDVAALAMMELSLAMHLRDERAGRVNGEDFARLGILEHRFWHAMRGKNDRLPCIGHFVQFLDENSTLRFQPLNHKFIMYDFMADIDRRAVNAERLLHCIDCTHHTGAKSARRAKEYMKLWHFGHGKWARISSFRWSPLRLSSVRDAASLGQRFARRIYERGKVCNAI